jgi:hypothetical protein
MHSQGVTLCTLYEALCKRMLNGDSPFFSKKV